MGQQETEPPRPPLRVGVLLDALEGPAWVERVLADVAASEAAELVVVVINGAPRRRRRLRDVLPFLVYAAYSRLDAALLGSKRRSPFRVVDLRARLGGLPTIEVRPRQTRYSDYVEVDDLSRIASHGPDVLLRFGFRILRGDILSLPRLGVWSYHHDDSAVIRGGPPGFWEVMEKRSTTGSVLQVLSEKLDAGRVLYRSLAPTHSRSVVRNREHVYWKSSAFVRRCLEAAVRNGGELPAAAATTGPYSGRLYRKPRNVQAMRILSRFLARGVRAALAERLGDRQWFIAHRDGDRPPAGEEAFRFREWRPPPDRFWADPFPVVREGGHYVFFEDYSFVERTGRIAFARLEGGDLRETGVALAGDTHLSYPFVFEHRGELFMVPESAAARRVALYRCVGFPADWELESVLLEDVHAVDATLHRSGDRWWMFVNVAEEGASHAHDELSLFWAASPSGPWHPVAGNPVKSDARSARPAGRLFEHAGALYRPAQDCSGRYGSAVSFQRVLALSRTEYREEEAWRLEPRWAPGLVGCHTWNRVAGLTTIDGCRWRPRLA